LAKQSFDRRAETAVKLSALVDEKYESARRDLDKLRILSGARYTKPLNWFERHPFISGFLVFSITSTLILVAHKLGWL
jgi:hypothetical protein